MERNSQIRPKTQNVELFCILNIISLLLLFYLFFFFLNFIFLFKYLFIYFFIYLVLFVSSSCSTLASFLFLIMKEYASYDDITLLCVETFCFLTGLAPPFSSFLKSKRGFHLHKAITIFFIELPSAVREE